MPAPAGALVVLLPIYLSLLGLFKAPAAVTLIYTLAIAGLMVSRLPVFSGKRVGKRVPPEMVLPVIVVVVLFFALLIAYPWWVLSIGTLLLSRARCRSAGCRIRSISAGMPPRLLRKAPPAVDIDQTVPPQPPQEPERPDPPQLSGVCSRITPCLAPPASSRLPNARAALSSTL